MRNILKNAMYATFLFTSTVSASEFGHWTVTGSQADDSQFWANSPAGVCSTITAEGFGWDELTVEHYAEVGDLECRFSGFAGPYTRGNQITVQFVDDTQCAALTNSEVFGTSNIGAASSSCMYGCQYSLDGDPFVVDGFTFDGGSPTGGACLDNGDSGDGDTGDGDTGDGDTGDGDTGDGDTGDGDTGDGDTGDGDTGDGDSGGDDECTGESYTDPVTGSIVCGSPDDSGDGDGGGDSGGDSGGGDSGGGDTGDGDTGDGDTGDGDTGDGDTGDGDTGDTGETDEEGEEEDTGTVSGGGSCTSSPSCSGDVIACAIVEQSWQTRCAVENLDTSNTDVVDAVDNLAQTIDNLNTEAENTQVGEFGTEDIEAAYSEATDNLTGINEGSSPFGTGWTGFSMPFSMGGGTCTSVLDMSFTIDGKHIDFTSETCAAFNIMRTLLDLALFIGTGFYVYRTWAGAQT